MRESHRRGEGEARPVGITQEEGRRGGSLVGITQEEGRLAGRIITGSEVKDQWVEAWSCTWVHEAQFLKSVLEAEGVDVLLPDEYTLGVDPFLAPAFHGVRLLVRSQDLPRARQILDSAAGEVPSPDDPTTPN